MKKTAKRRYRPLGRKGFTLSETLVAVLILMMVTAVIAGALPAAQKAYYSVVDGANARILVSTTVTALREQLESATGVEVDDGGTSVTYVSGDNGALSRISSGDNGIMLEEYLDYAAGTASGDTSRLLVSDKAASGRLWAAFDSLSYADGLFTVTGLKVFGRESDQELAGADIVVIRVLTDRV